MRAAAGSGDNTLIVGFVLKGTGTKKLLIRGVGPTLTLLSVDGVLPDPQIEVYRGSPGTLIASNNDWGRQSTSPDVANAIAQVGAFGLPDGSKDAALLLTLDPDQYSVHLTSAGPATGIALVEVYEVQ